MNRKELVELLNEIAEKDLSDGSDIHDHPCTVAVRAINKCFDDIDYLKSIVNSGKKPVCKKAVVLVKTSYTPSW